MPFFHVHVLGTHKADIKAGRVWVLEPAAGEAAAEFPAGLTHLGVRHAASTTRDQQQAIELLVEAVRRLVAPAAPSRFQSVFAFESEADADAFVARYRPDEPTAILRVEGECGHRGDIELLTGFGIAGARSLVNARRYWEGSSVGGLRECLLVPPVSVLERLR